MSRIARSGAQWCAGADWYWSARGKCAHLSPTPLSVMSDRQLEIGPGESIYTKEVIQVPQIRLVFFLSQEPVKYLAIYHWVDVCLTF